MTKLNLLSASTLLLLCSYVVPSAGNSNMVSITHRSSLNGRSNDYSSGLNVVKSSYSNNYSSSGYINDNSSDSTNEAEEYVTNFYRQKRIEKRALAAQAVGMEEANTISQEEDCHSLDHYYFDHDAVAVQSGGGDVTRRRRAFFRRRDINSNDVSDEQQFDDNYDSVQHHNKRPAFLPKNKQQLEHARDRVASSVRGGSISQQVLQQQQGKQHGNRNNNFDDDGGKKKNHRGHGHSQHHHSRRNHNQRRNSQPQQRPSVTFSHRGGKSNAQYQRHDGTRQVSDIDKFNYSDPDTDDRDDDDEYDDHYDYSSNHDEEDDDYEASNSNSMPPHQAGLLRVPCSLRLNSSENTHHHHHHSHTTTNNNKSTPIAAYVDTGAQVTVISATAARRVGILHLIDRRYAGRATGVGHCRVLGRIPAGCVQFVLGQQQQRDDDDCEDYDNDDEYDYDDEGGTTTVQMNGPALTVLEGTVTEGVDMLLGLDVLHEWEATIQMGGSARQSSMTVKKRGMLEPVVLPFLVGSDDDDSSKGGVGGNGRKSRRSASAATATNHHGRQQHQRRNRRSKQQQRQQANHHHDDGRHKHHVQREHEDNKEDNDDDSFSPVSSDIESDLDILDQSEFTHEFPDEGRRRRVKQCSDKIVHDIEREDELLGVRHSQRYLRNERDGEEDDDDLLQDSSDEEDEDNNNDDEVTFDMSGL